MSYASPKLSVVLPTDSYETIGKTLRHLRTQSVRDQIEIVIVTPLASALGLADGAVEGFHSLSIVEVDSLACLPRARAQGVRAATAPVVLFGETHAYPHPRCAEALVEAHEGPWAVVGPAIYNANPGTLLSWSNIFMDYGPWVQYAHRGIMEDVPGHNGAYKRSVLLEYGCQLEDMMESDTVLNADLRSKGYKLYLEPAARTFHLNISQPGAWISERFNAGRTFAAVRAVQWRWQKRILYILGAPLIPLIRLARLLQCVRRSGRAPELLPQLVPVLIAGLVLSALGELFGYAFGAGSAPGRVYEFELHRARYVRSSEQQTETEHI